MHAGLAITFVNRTISGQILLVYRQNSVCAVAMSKHTRDRKEPSSSSSSLGPPTKKCAVSRKTVEKWVVENNRELNTSVWLNSRVIATTFSLKCAVCSV